eukprot:367853-Rhodomonas_salina.7
MVPLPRRALVAAPPISVFGIGTLADGRSTIYSVDTGHWVAITSKGIICSGSAGHSVSLRTRVSTGHGAACAYADSGTYPRPSQSGPQSPPRSPQPVIAPYAMSVSRTATKTICIIVINGAAACVNGGRPARLMASCCRDISSDTRSPSYNHMPELRIGDSAAGS